MKAVITRRPGGTRSIRRRVVRALCSVATAASLAIASPLVADTVIGFGDSITQGSPYNLTAPNGGRYGGYIPHLEQQIAELVPHYVENWGISGSESIDGVNRIGGLLDARRPQWILIMYGTNDLWENISLQSTIANLRFMIDAARVRGVEPVLSNLLPSTVQGHASHLIPSVFNPAIRALALEKRVYFNDAYSRFEPNWPILHKDHLHPNLEGYRQLAISWCDTIPICNEDADPPLSPAPPPFGSNLPWLDVLLMD